MLLIQLTGSEGNLNQAQSVKIRIVVRSLIMR